MPTEWHDELDSTMTRAAALVDAGCETGTIVAARRQSAGQGRLGRSWHSPDGGLYFTIVLRPRVELQRLPVVTLALGVAVADLLNTFAAANVDLRWPNDVMAGGKKLVGILAQWHKGAVLAGIGLNISASEFPPDLAPIATSLLLATGKSLPPDRLLAGLTRSIQTHVGLLETAGTAAILTLFEAASSYCFGMRVRVELPTGDLIGTTAGLTPDGFLRLRLDNGEEQILNAGGGRPL